MARADWGNQGRGWKLCSYKRTTIVICSINIVAALYVVHSIYTSLFIFSTHGNASLNYYAGMRCESLVVGCDFVGFLGFFEVVGLSLMNPFC